MLGILTWCFADTVFNIRSSDNAADFMLSGLVETTKLQRDKLSGRQMEIQKYDGSTDQPTYGLTWV